MNDISNIMKVKDGIVGLIVGDALGVPVEFKSGYDLSQNPITKMKGYGTYNQPAGTWSDDSAMTLATMHSIVQKQGIDYDDIMDKFVAWYSEAKYMQGNSTFDCGVTTSNAISRYVGQNTPALESGCKGERDNGNGSLMRILPLAYVKDIDYETIENVSGLTHAHPRSKIACVLYVEMAKSMLENSGLTMEEHIFSACDKIKEYYKDSPELKHFDRIFNNDLEIVSGKGYVISTFEVVVRCLLITDAGIYYGFDSIPVDWVNEIDRIDEVLSLCERFEEFCDESQ